ncbi:hypothetical protein B0A50_05423 [Salinomyces thailandicus]|uniref:Uncharacterized protein n=1 Tax=Salinomyces thailandicus TaxID=706561 RepID=A0A4U0TUD3_9PEZI|nr:hypothetical protein B0A50_05423 [Salinomyces thailandica]
MSAPPIPQNLTIHPRSSTETDRRHLLAADSIAPSESASMVNYNPGDETPRAHSFTSTTTTTATTPTRTPRPSSDQPPPYHNQRPNTLPSPFQQPQPQPQPQPQQQQQPQPYKGFPSQQAYLTALQDWAESKKYIQVGDNGLTGFYGTTTMEQYASKPKVEIGLGLGLRRKLRARREARAEARAGVGRGGEGEGQGEVVVGGERERRNTVT